MLSPRPDQSHRRGRPTCRSSSSRPSCAAAPRPSGSSQSSTFNMQLGSSGMWCLRMWCLIIIVVWPYHILLFIVTSMPHLLLSNTTSSNTTSLNSRVTLISMCVCACVCLHAAQRTTGSLGRTHGQTDRRIANIRSSRCFPANGTPAPAGQLAQPTPTLYIYIYICVCVYISIYIIRPILGQYDKCVSMVHGCCAWDMWKCGTPVQARPSPLQPIRRLRTCSDPRMDTLEIRG